MNRSATARRVLLGSGMYALFALAGLVGRYSQTILSRGDFVPGDEKDTRYGIFLLEHWYHVMTGHAHWQSPPFFFPTQGALGYSDTFFLFTPIYVPCRALGLDPYTAYQAVLIGFSTLGFVGMAFLLRRYLRIEPVLSAVGGLVFAFSSMLHAAHFQLQMVALVPFLVALALESIRRRKRGQYEVATWLAAACLALYGAIAFSSFHVAWYSGLLVLIFAGLSGLAAIRRHGLRSSVLVTREWIGRNAPRVALVGTTGMLALVPMGLTYFPVYRVSAGYGHVLGVRPSPIDLINVGPDNAAWGGLEQQLGVLVHHVANAAFQKGFGLALLVTFGWTVAWVSIRRRKLPVTDPARSVDRTLLLAALSVAVAWLLVVQVREHSLLPILRMTVPGATAIRDFVRIHIPMSVVVVVIAMVGLQSLLTGDGSSPRATFRWWRRIVLVLVIGALALETQTVRHPQGFSKAEELAYLDQFSPPPAGCRSFYGVVTASGPREPWFRSVDAMLIGQRLGIPTINGNTQQAPHGWDRALRRLGDPEYPEAVHRWAVSHAVADGLCELDLDRATWRGPTGVTAQSSRPEYPQ